MEELKQGWKKRISWLVIAIIVVFFYKMLDNFSNIQEWFVSFMKILKPFMVGLLLSYILYIPCKKIECLLNKSKIKIIAKKSRGLSVVLTYILLVLILIVVINCIFPILKESFIELFNNIPNYYDIIVNKISEIPQDSLLNNDTVKDVISEVQNVDVKQFININNGKIVEYAKNLINVFLGLFDLFVATVVSVYILLQRTTIINFLRKLTRAIFKKETFDAIDKYFIRANQVFFTFITSQLLDAIIVGILTTVAMIILKVKYAFLLGFLIGLFNMIPYIGAIVAVAIGIVITLITGGIGQTVIMAVVVVILQQIDANIINPKIIGSSLEVSPLLVIFAITIGGAYFGIIGMFLAVPIAVVIKTVLEDYVDAKNKQRDEEEKKIKES